MLKEIKNNLKELGFDNNEIRVYVALTQLGEATASRVAKKADLPRTTAISLLNRLSDANYFTRHIYKGKTYYWIESPKVISGVFEQKVQIAENLNKLLDDLYRSEARFPFVRGFDTRTGIKNFIDRFMADLPPKAVIYTIDNPRARNYAKIYFKNIEEILVKQKKKKVALTQSLIPYGTFGDIEEFKLKNQTIKIREMPEAIKFESSLWIAENEIVHFSGNPLFLTVIKHEAVYKSVKSLYDFLWNISTPKN
ncbi:MAG: helix-turn-helix domain-containing protein [Candidatus Nealsonbacteria bacterium]